MWWFRVYDDRTEEISTWLYHTLDDYLVGLDKFESREVPYKVLLAFGNFLE